MRSAEFRSLILGALACLLAAATVACTETEAPSSAADAGASHSDATVHPDAAVVSDASSTVEDASANDATPGDGAPGDGTSGVADAEPANPDAGVAADASARAPIEGSFIRLVDFDDFSKNEVTESAEGHLILATGQSGTDPYGPGGYEGGNYYNGGTYRYGIAISPILEWAQPIDEIVPSFEAETPPGTWVTLKLRARMAGTGAWTKDYVLAVWAYDSDTIQRHSVDNQGDADGDVLTDTLALARTADAIQLIAVLCAETPAVTPKLRALAASAINTATAPRPDTGDPNARGTILPVPGRSQMIYPDGGQVWCSPTTTSMLLAYWSEQLNDPALLETVPNAAALTYDWIYDGNGNWPFNTAHAAAVANGRLHAFVTRLESFGEVERLIAAGIPIAISVSYGNGELTNSPIRSTAGHLLAVKGFTAGGDVIANDPAFSSNDTVEVEYDRSELDQAWSHSRRTVYIIYPRERALPINPLGSY